MTDPTCECGKIKMYMDSHVAISKDLVIAQEKINQLQARLDVRKPKYVKKADRKLNALDEHMANRVRELRSEIKKISKFYKNRLTKAEIRINSLNKVIGEMRVERVHNGYYPKNTKKKVTDKPVFRMKHYRLNNEQS